MRIPSEIKNFFEVEEGQTLLIKGLPGTGKTTLAIEIMNFICKKNNGMYISTRISPSRIYAMFPWINDVIPPNNVINATQSMLLKSLGSINTEGSSYEVILEFFKAFFDEADDMDDPMIVIDSWDAMVNYTSHILGDALHSLEQNICEFAHDMGIHLIFVSECVDLMPLDYIVDGVVTLGQFEISGQSSSDSRSADMMNRCAREIHLDKLRGVKISQKAYTCTLHVGRFQYFEPHQEHINACIMNNVERVSDISESCISTGIPDLDVIIGGLKYGSCNVLEIGYGVGKRYYPILTALASNSVKNGRALHIIPSIGYQLDPRDIFMPSNVMILEPNGDPDQWYQTRFRQEDALREHIRRPILNIIGMDSMESSFGYENIVNRTNHVFQKWKETNDINVEIVKTGQKCINMIAGAADTHFVIKDLNGGLCIYGLIPRTEPYYITQDSEKKISLVPIV
ncbi:MAG: gas vesicle protein GvpD P-loop domain-containing protein [Methanotrichaceae archaeon]